MRYSFAINFLLKNKYIKMVRQYHGARILFKSSKFILAHFTG